MRFEEVSAERIENRVGVGAIRKGEGCQRTSRVQEDSRSEAHLR